MDCVPNVKFMVNEQAFANLLHEDMSQHLGCVGGSAAPIDLQLDMMVDAESNEFSYKVVVSVAKRILLTGKQWGGTGVQSFVVTVAINVYKENPFGIR